MFHASEDLREAFVDLVYTIYDEFGNDHPQIPKLVSGRNEDTQISPKGLCHKMVGCGNIIPGNIFSLVEDMREGVDSHGPRLTSHTYSASARALLRIIRKLTAVSG
jgi:hypothetical protein